ncbi:hypothetical protein ACB092_07G173600 [Castanea dentata]
MVVISLGSETDGSILCPSSYNLVVGIKSTVGLTSRVGVIPISPRQETVGQVDLDYLDYDPGTCKQIWKYHVNQRDEIRRAYIKNGLHQPPLETYKKSGKHNRNVAYCLPCFVFHNPNGVVGQKTFTVGGFRNWKKVGGKNCYFQDPNLAHRVAKQMCKDLMNQRQHIQRVVDHLITEQITNNRLQPKASIYIVWHLAFQAISFRGRDKTFSSSNHGNFLEGLNINTFWNEKVADIIQKTPKNATYTSPKIQKEILHVYSVKVKKAIREEIGDAKFCIIVDEARDESMKEQMAVVFRYVDREGFVKERIQNIRGQGYDGASNMRASKQVVPISGFFLELLLVIKTVNTSCMRNEQLKVANTNEIACLIDLEELETRILLNIIDDASDGEHRAEAESAYDSLTSFEFVFILHLEKETIEITDKLCQALQSQSQDILNAIHLVPSTKAFIQKFRDDGWDSLLTTVISFCEKYCIDVLDMNACYVGRQGRAHNQQDNELNHQFNEDAMELLRLSSVLEPREALKSFKSSDLCLLIKNFYSQDFTNYDKQLVRIRNSEHYKFVYRMVRLVLTLSVSTATTELAFSAMKVVKTSLRNKMENDFLTDSLMLYIENDIALTFSLDSTVDDFKDLKER